MEINSIKEFRMSDVRNTVQRKLVLDAVRNLANHPTPEEVYRHIHQEHPTISKSTVYRNLHYLCEIGELLHLPTPNAADHIDHQTHSHFHCVCRQCKRVFDIEELQSDIPLPRDTVNFQYEKCHVFFSGICSKCSQIK